MLAGLPLDDVDHDSDLFRVFNSVPHYLPLKASLWMRNSSRWTGIENGAISLVSISKAGVDVFLELVVTVSINTREKLASTKVLPPRCFGTCVKR